MSAYISLGTVDEVLEAVFELRGILCISFLLIDVCQTIAQMLQCHSEICMHCGLGLALLEQILMAGFQGKRTDVGYRHHGCGRERT
jgi:hypothetical protein